LGDPKGDISREGLEEEGYQIGRELDGLGKKGSLGILSRMENFWIKGPFGLGFKKEGKGPKGILAGLRKGLLKVGFAKRVVVIPG